MGTNTKEKKKREDELMQALAAGAGITSNTAPDTGESKTSTRRSKKGSNSGASKKTGSIQTTTTLSLSKKVTISLYPEDHQIIRELSAFLASQGLPVNKSLVIKAALRSVTPGNQLLEAYGEARSLDKRMTAEGALKVA